MPINIREKIRRYRVNHPDDLPREKIRKVGISGLSNQELLAVIVRTGVPGRDVFKLCRSILKSYPLQKLAELSYQDLIKVKGIGQSKAAILMACFELGRRALDKGLHLRPTIQTPRDAVALAGEIVDRRKENLIGFYLNGRNQVIERETLSVGTLDASLVHPREVFFPAVQHNAAAVLLVHNHPSGDSEPSPADIEVTKRLDQAGTMMGIRLIDHIIVCQNGFTSLKEKHYIS